MARCARPLCHLPDAAPPRIRGIRRAGGVTALGTPQIASRERQVEISYGLTATSAQNRCISQPVARALWVRGPAFDRSRGSRWRKGTGATVFPQVDASRLRKVMGCAHRPLSVDARRHLILRLG